MNKETLTNDKMRVCLLEHLPWKKCLHINSAPSQNGAMSSRDQPLQKVSTKKTTNILKYWQIDTCTLDLQQVPYQWESLLYRGFVIGAKQFESIKSIFFQYFNFEKRVNRHWGSAVWARRSLQSARMQSSRQVPQKFI